MQKSLTQLYSLLDCSFSRILVAAFSWVFVFSAQLVAQELPKLNELSNQLGDLLAQPNTWYCHAFCFVKDHPFSMLLTIGILIGAGIAWLIFSGEIGEWLMSLAVGLVVLIVAGTALSLTWDSVLSFFSCSCSATDSLLDVLKPLVPSN